MVEQLASAFRNDDATTVALLLENHPHLKEKINEPHGPFNSPVITAVQSVEMLDTLLAAGANIDAKSDWWAGGFGLLHCADPHIAQAAIERGATIDIHAAARLGLIDRLRELIKEDPDLVHARGGDGQTPLHFASSVEIAEYLLENGAEMDVLDLDHESTPAQYMVAKRPDVARHLVSRGCKTDLLMVSALGLIDNIREILDDNPESIRLRVSDEFFPMIDDKTGGTIYQWELGWYVYAHQVAKRFGHDEAFEYLVSRSPDDVKLLVACWLGDAPAIEEVLIDNPKCGRNLLLSDQRQLAHAARNNDPVAVHFMLQAGLPVNARGQHNATTLHWAAWNGNLDMVEEILQFHPVIDDRENDYETTPLSWALYASTNGWHPDKGDYPEVVRTLLKSGAKAPESLRGSPGVRAVLREYGVNQKK